MRILVTGGAGFIGSHIVEHYAGKAKVRVLDNFRSGFRKNLAPFDVELIEGSITDRDAVRAAVADVDYVFHLAAMISVPESTERPEECAQINVLGLLNVLAESAAAGVKKLCFSSSAAIYGDNPDVPKRETMLPEPKSPYAVTKLDGEYYCRMFTETGRLNTACMRYFNVFGPRQDPKSQYAAAIPIFTEKAIRNQPLRIFGNGEQTRDFVYVKDVVAANAYLAEHSQHTGVHNVGYGRSVTINKLAQQIIQLTGSASGIEYADPRAGDVMHSLADISRLTATGFRCTDRFDEGLQNTIAFFREILYASR